MCAAVHALELPRPSYLTYHGRNGVLKAEPSPKFAAGRMGPYTIEKDLTRPKGLRIVMGPFSVYDKSNVEAAAN